MEGIIVKSTGSWYVIETADKARIMARLKGKFRIKGIKSTNPVAVGDGVRFVMEGDEGVIDGIHERKNYIIRRSINLSKQQQIIAANIDQLFLVVTLKKPRTFLGFVDRFLIGAEAYRIPVILIYNKVDLLQTEEEQESLAEWKVIYQKAAYEQLEVSALNNLGIEKLKELMKGKLSIFAGHSGVGKSTLINVLAPEHNLRVNKISDSHHSGKHTTTFAEMFDLPFGAKIIDTPGIKGFGNVDLEKDHLAHYFPEMRALLNQCKFDNCVHINEPDCAVKKAVKENLIAKSRYQSYISIYNEDEDENFRQKGY